MADVTATNPQTGERFRLVNNKWVPEQSNLETLGREALSSSFGGAQNLVKQFGHATVDPVVNPLIRARNFLASGGDNRQLEADPRFVTDRNMDIIQQPSQPMQDFGNLNPSLNLPTTSGNQLMGAAQRAGEGAAALATGDFSQFSPSPTQDQAAITQQGQMQNPIMASAGDLLGTAALIVSGRAPQASVNNIRDIAKNLLAERGGFGFMRGAAKPFVGRGASTLKRAVNNAFTRSDMAQFISKTFPRVKDAAVDGAMIGIIEDSDPMAVAGAAAGLQFGGSLALTTLDKLAVGKSLPAKGLSLVGEAAGLAAFMEMAKGLVPGGEERDFARVFDSFSSSFTKIMAGMSLGMFAGAAGLGRTSMRNKSYMDAITSASDALTRLPRATVFTMVSDAFKDDRVEPTIKKIASDPGAFGDSAARRIQRAIDNNQSLSPVLDNLEQSNSDFRDFLEGI